MKYLRFIAATAVDTAKPFFYENWIIIKQLIWLFGQFMSGILFVLDKINIHSIALAIVVFTIVTKMLLLPLTIKQQKVMRLNQYINPELQAIQKKYKGKTDTISQQKMIEEQRAVQEKYGVSMASGCMPMLIQFPILFALYPVIYRMEQYVSYLSTLKETLTADQFTRMWQLLGINLQEAPGWKLSWAILIPILTALSQLLSTWIAQARQNDTNNGDNPMGSSMKIMNYLFPIMFGVFAVSMPAFLGFYWIVQSLTMVLQQIVINKYLDKIPAEELIRQNIEKANKKRARKGLPPLGEKATMSTRNISARPVSPADRSKADAERQEKIRQSTEYYQSRSAAPNSLAAKANMVRDYNERNKK